MVTPLGLGIAKHIKRDSVADIFPGAHAMDGFLHLAVTTVAAFHGVGSRREQLIVEEGECLFQVGAEEFLEGLAELLEAAHPGRRSLASFCRAVSLRQRRSKSR